MMKTQLKIKMLEHGDKASDLAKHLGITETTLSRKLNGHSKWYLDEASKIKKRYNLSKSEFEEVFDIDSSWVIPASTTSFRCC